MEPNAELLGRRPSTPDARDFTVAMVKSASAVELAYQRLLVSRGANPAVKEWATEMMAVLFVDDPEPEPEPEPDPLVPVVWDLPDPVLDQGETGHCGGFGGGQWGNLSPVNDHYRTSDCHALYYESVSIGGYPGTEDGVESRWVAQALQARGRLATYAFAKTAAEVRDWVRTKGPVMMGTDWTERMFEPAADGLTEILGDWAGGHFWVIAGDLPVHDYDDEQGVALCLNSWGEEWGQGGWFKLRWSDVAILMHGLEYPGDAIVSPELAI